MFRKIYKGFDQKLLLLVQLISECNNYIWICDRNTYWLYYIFPSIWTAAIRGVKICLLTNPCADNKENYRRWLLKQIGCHVYTIDSLPFYGFLFEQYGNTKLALIDDNIKFDNNSVEYTERKVRLYTEKLDYSAICNFWNLLNFWQIKLSSMQRKEFLFETCSQKKLFDKLRNVEQYRNAQFSIETIDVRNVMLLQHYIKEYKFIQISQLVNDLYNDNNFELFQPLKLTFEDSTYSIITPPIVEINSKKLVVIEGNTRFFYCLQKELYKIKVVIVNNVTEPLPGEAFSISDVNLTSLTLPLDVLISKLSRKSFRKIEEKIHIQMLPSNLITE